MTAQTDYIYVPKWRKNIFLGTYIYTQTGFSLQLYYDKEFEDENKKEEDSPKIENEEKNQEVNVVEKTE